MLLWQRKGLRVYTFASMTDANEISVGDTVILYNDFGTKVEASVVAILEELGLKTYKVVSKDFVLVVSRQQIAEVHRK